MSKISITGASTGSATFTLESPATSTNRTLTLPDNTGTIITQNSTPAFASTIGVGGATAAASGAGITFPATQSASSDANTLDDYEEGTWTPEFQNQLGTRVDSATTRMGRYTKIGNRVFFNFWMSGNTLSGASTAVYVTLPVTVSNSSNQGYGSISVWPFSGFTVTGSIISRTEVGVALFILQSFNNGSSGDITSSNFSGNLNFMAMGHYIAA